MRANAWRSSAPPECRWRPCASFVYLVLLETMAFEFMLSRCSSEIAAALTNHYSIPKAALLWFELHSGSRYPPRRGRRDRDQDCLNFHQIPDPLFDQIAHVHSRRQPLRAPLLSAARNNALEYKIATAQAQRIESRNHLPIAHPVPPSFSPCAAQPRRKRRGDRQSHRQRRPQRFRRESAALLRYRRNDGNLWSRVFATTWRQNFSSNFRARLGNS